MTPLSLDTLTCEQVQERLRYFQIPEFTFDEPTHTYHLDGVKIPSVTTILSKLKRPYDAPYHARNTALKTGMSYEEVLAMWAANTERACWLGSQVHEYIEHYYNGWSPDPNHPDPEVRNRIQKFHQLVAGRLAGFRPVGQEVRMFHRRAGLAGTLDFLGMFQGKLWVGDWKTNKEIKTDKSKCWGNLLGDFKDLKENEHNIYSMQISIYRLFLAEIGIETEGGFIAHIPKGDEPPMIYKVIDYRERLKPLLNKNFVG